MQSIKSLASSWDNARPPSWQHRRKSRAVTVDGTSPPDAARRFRSRSNALARSQLDPITLTSDARSVLTPPHDGWRDTSQPRGASAHHTAVAFAGEAGALSGCAHSKTSLARATPVGLSLPPSRAHSTQSPRSPPSTALRRPPIRRQYRSAAAAPASAAICAGGWSALRQSSARSRPRRAALHRSNSRRASMRRALAARRRAAVYFSCISSKRSASKSSSVASRAASKFARSTWPRACEWRPTNEGHRKTSPSILWLKTYLLASSVCVPASKHQARRPCCHRPGKIEGPSRWVESWDHFRAGCALEAVAANARDRRPAQVRHDRAREPTLDPVRAQDRALCLTHAPPVALSVHSCPGRGQGAELAAPAGPLRSLVLGVVFYPCV